MLDWIIDPKQQILKNHIKKYRPDYRQRRNECRVLMARIVAHDKQAHKKTSYTLDMMFRLVLIALVIGVPIYVFNY
jgi:hypothetical protein